MREFRNCLQLPIVHIEMFVVNKPGSVTISICSTARIVPVSWANRPPLVRVPTKRYPIYHVLFFSVVTSALTWSRGCHSEIESDSWKGGLSRPGESVFLG